MVIIVIVLTVVLSPAAVVTGIALGKILAEVFNG
jgi:hypothetical protein